MIRYDGDRTEVVVLMFILITGIFGILMQIPSLGGVIGVLRLQGGFHSLSGHMLEGRFLVVIISSRKVFLCWLVLYELVQWGDMDHFIDVLRYFICFVELHLWRVWYSDSMGVEIASVLRMQEARL